MNLYEHYSTIEDLVVSMVDAHDERTKPEYWDIDALMRMCGFSLIKRLSYMTCHAQRAIHRTHLLLSGAAVS